MNTLPISTVKLLNTAWRAARLHDAFITLAMGLPGLLAVCVLAKRFLGLGIATGMGGAGLLLLAVVLAWRWRKRDAHWLVRALNASRPDMEDSADLLLHPHQPSALQQLQQQRLVQRLHARPPDLRAAWPIAALSVSLLLALLVAAAALWLPHVSKPTAPPSARPVASTPQALPRLLRASVRVAPPAYTGLPTRTASTLSIKAPQGSEVQWQLQLSGAPKHVMLVLLDGQRIGLRPSNSPTDGGWSARILLAASRLYRVQADGRWLENGKLHRLDATPDLPPQVTVLQPSQSLSLAPPGQRTWPLAFAARDDYGVLATAKLRITLAQGSGENIRFKEHNLTLTGQGSGKQRSFRHTLDLQALGMADGDDLIVQLEVADNRSPQPQLARSPSVILRISGQPATERGGMEGVVRRVLPAYFRSQRQIIIDAEALQKQRRTLPAEKFLKQSDAIGVDQRILRLRYGQFLGEEADGGHKPPPTADDAPEAAPTHAANASTSTDTNTDHAHDAAGTSPTFGNIDHLLETFGHTHDIAEAATLLDPQTRAILKQALDQMWQSELQLRQGQPDRALPFAYKALGFVKQVQQSQRIYLARVGPELPPIDASRRLSGKREGIASRPAALQAATPADAGLESLWQALALPAGTPPPALPFAALDGWLRAHPTRAQDPLALQAALDSVRHTPACKPCREDLQRQLWPLLQTPPAAPLRRTAASAQGRRYLDALHSKGGP